MPRAKKIKDKSEKKGTESKEEVVEYFDFEKGGKERIVEAKGEEIVREKTSNDQINRENKTVRNVLIVSGAIILLLVAYYFAANRSSHFEYNGVKFEIVKEIAPYKTSFPVIYQNKTAIYNFYLRNDPRKNNVSFNGELNLKPLMVINATNNLNCNGSGVISVGNMANLQIFGTKIVKDENMSCDSQGRYMFVDLVEGDKSGIDQFGPSCYKLSVANCEVIDVTEKFLLEWFAKATNITKSA